MSDIVERLRAWHTPGETVTGDVQLYLDAADEIERLRAAFQLIADTTDDLSAEMSARAAISYSSE